MKIRFLNMQSHTDFVQLILGKRKKSYVLFIAALVHWLLFSLGHWLLRNLLNLLLVFRHSFKNVWIPCFIIVSSRFFFAYMSWNEGKIRIWSWKNEPQAAAVFSIVKSRKELREWLGTKRAAAKLWWWHWIQGDWVDSSGLPTVRPVGFWD